MIYPKQKFQSLAMLILLLLSTGFLFPSCKKDSNVTSTYVAQNEVRDSAYLITKDIYLWSELLPSITDFQPRNLKDIYAVMNKVRSYQPLDRFSFVETKAETEQSQQGLDSDFGFLVKFYTSQTDLRVNYVYATSPAGVRGVQRGWKVLSINGRTMSGSQSDIDFLNNLFFGNATSADFNFQLPDGSTQTITIPKGIYALNTVLYKNIYTNGPQKVGYFVFNQFSGPSSVNELITTINYFQSNGINDLIVDLRYNRGGYVTTQDPLANMLAPQSVGFGQKTMYTYVFNQKYSKWNETTKFYKTGSLNLNRIVFIVTPSTASASELLINNLRPVMQVKLVGEKNTYGKPVGFFPIPVFNYNIYPVSFKTVNSVGSADYYQGFPVDKNASDDLSRNFGDESEASLKEALNYLYTGNFTATAQKRIMAVGSIPEYQLDNVNKAINEQVPKVQIENRYRKMPQFIRERQKR
ncbi:MAG TPA: S41 family peptidase [Daejeonella sp.]|nr:S41 family peptidase [Daejeonella sp.]